MAGNTNGGTVRDPAIWGISTRYAKLRDLMHFLTEEQAKQERLTEEGCNNCEYCQNLSALDKAVEEPRNRVNENPRSTASIKNDEK